MDLQPKPTSLFFCLHVSIIKRELTYALSFFLALASSAFVIGLVGPFKPLSLIPPSNNFGSLNKSQFSESPRDNVCDYSSGRWVRDERHRLGSYSESCPFLDPGFRCRKNGRRDEDYLNWRWQPDHCDLPRCERSLDPVVCSSLLGDLLERTRNGRIVFAGDSLGRNQWESLICMLAQGVSNRTNIYEEHGKPITKHKGFLSIRFADHNLTVEYYRTPFLVLTGRPPTNSSDHVLRAIMVDRLHWYAEKWVGASLLVFNAGHWWNKDKTVKMGSHFHEGGVVNMKMDVMEAFQKSLRTWQAWATQKLDPEKAYIFFRSYSPVHYRGGTWKEGGSCNTNIAPETDYTKLEAEPSNNKAISDVIKQMSYANRMVQFLNISYLSELRIDGHPSSHREPGTPVPAVQDCSHWCLPGVPDTWNELLYAHLLSKDFKIK